MKIPIYLPCPEAFTMTSMLMEELVSDARPTTLPISKLLYMTGWCYIRNSISKAFVLDYNEDWITAARNIETPQSVTNEIHNEAIHVMVDLIICNASAERTIDTVCHFIEETFKHNFPNRDLTDIDYINFDPRARTICFELQEITDD